MKNLNTAIKSAMAKAKMMKGEEKMEKMPKGKSLKVKTTKKMSKY
jgi:TusA-related sulfurtransferase